MNQPKHTKPGIHKQMVFRLFVIVLGMFGFGYGLVPIYKAVCAVTGVNVLSRQEAQAEPMAKRNSQVDMSRTVEVVFDANNRGTWQFKPEKSSMLVHPGEVVSIKYDIHNMANRDVEGQAIPSYLPKKAAAHFHKLECFCFKQQPFKANEVKALPVVFTVDADLPKDVKTITLSYTFFEVGLPSAKAD